MSAPASTMAREERLFHFGFATEMENASVPLNASGRRASGMSLSEPITIVTGPASSVLVMILGFLPKTFAKSDRKSSVAFRSGPGVFSGSRITAEPSTRIAVELELAGTADVLCVGANSDIAQKETRIRVGMAQLNSARKNVQPFTFI